MADERVNVTIDIDVKDLKQLTAVTGALKGFDLATNRTSRMTDKLTGALGANRIMMHKNEKGAVSFTRQLGLIEKVGGMFVKRARMIMFATIGMAAEFGVSALTLASVNGLFVVGQYAMKAYNIGMQALAGTVAAFGVAAIGAAAAFKEFQAAQYQFRYKDSKEVGSALDQSGFALRSLYKDATLASFGMQGLSSAFAAVSKQSAFTPATKAALKAMADFAQASGDPQKSLAAAANFVGLMQKNKKFTGETLAAAKQISPEFEKAFKKGGYKDVQKFMDDLTSGKLATSAGVAGQADAVNKTLFAQFKQYMSEGLVELSDIGTRVLEPIKEAMFNIFQGLLRTFRRVSGDLVGFGKGPFLNSLVEFTYRIEEFTVTLFRKFLPATQGFWKRIGTVFQGLKVYFYEVRDALDRMRDGGSIVIKTFGKPLLEIFKQIGSSAAKIGDLAKNNRENWEKFSDAITRFVKGFFDLSRGFRTAFDAALPIISLIVKFVGQLGSLIGKLLELGSNLPGVFGTVGGSLGALGVGYAAYKGRRAARFTNRIKSGQMSAGEIPVTLEEAMYSGLPMRAFGEPSGPEFSPLSGNMTSATGSMAGEDPLAMATRFGEMAKQADTIGKLKIKKPEGKGGGKGGKDPLGLGDTLKSKTINVYGDVVNVGRSRGKGPGGKPDYPTGNKNPTVGINPGRMQGMLNPSNPISYVHVPTLPGGYGGMAVRQMENVKEGERRRQAGETARQRMARLRGFDLTPKPPAVPLRQQYNPYEESRKTGRGLHGIFPKGSLKRFGNFIWNGTTSTSLNPASSIDGGVTGAMAGTGAMGGAGGAAGGNGLRQRLGRFFIGQSYDPNEKRGFRGRTRQFLGASFGESKFAEGYKNAQDNARASGQKFNRVKGLKAGLGNSLSGAGMVGSLLASQGISMLQNKGIVSEEAAPGMQLGASLMAINPMLGLAAGAGMTAFSAKTKMGGAVSGAVAGAALGSMILPGVGTVIGAALGGLAGMVKASFNQSGEARKGVKRIGEQFMSQVASAALAGVNTGSTTGARMQVERFQELSKSFGAAKTKEERTKLLKPFEAVLGKNQFDLMTGEKSGAAQVQFQKTANNMKAALTPAFNQFDDVMRSLMLSTGKTGDEIMQLAMEKNVNLYDSTLKLSDITARLGEGMIKTAEQFGQALRDVQVASMSVFADFKRNKEMKDAIQGAGDTLRGGDTSAEAFADYLSKQADFLSFTNPDSPLLNIVSQLRGIGVGQNVGKGALFQTGGSLNNVGMSEETAGLIRGMGEKQITGSSFAAASQLASMITDSGFQFANADLGRKNLEIQIQTLMRRAAAGDTTAIGAVGKLEEDLKRGTALQGKGAEDITTYLSNLFGGSVLTGDDRRLGQGGARGTSYMGTELIGSLAGDYEKFGKALNEEAAALREGFLDAIETGFFAAKGTPDWWNQTPNWWANGLKIEDNKIVPADTRTPRGGRVGDTSVSKTLGRTMSRHNYFNGMLTGKRTITSSWRDTNLGSPSSDHVTGKAYDLTGQNLGQYASLIKDAGGFAEFHGAAGSRHLHVVPPAAPTGDTSTAKVAMAANGTGGAPISNDNFTINVYESNNPKATAEEVAKKIMAMQRNWKQRS